MERPIPFTALVLAADRGPEDPVAKYSGTSCKAVAPVAGRLMILRVIEALEGSSEVDRVILCGPQEEFLAREPALADLVATGRVSWLAPQRTPSISVSSALASVPAEVPVLVTTADHALLKAEMVDHFCGQARQSGADVVAGVASYEKVAEAFPDTRRTVTRMRDGGYCGCNLFAFLTPAGRGAADFWRKVEQQRKSPLKVIKVLGWMTVIRYVLGLLTLSEALNRLSRRMGAKAGRVMMPFPEAAVDVDKVSDLELVEAILRRRQA